jgi:choline monooxygenase
MFVSETHLPQLLSVSHYTDSEFAQREQDALFRPGWHAVAVTDQLPKVGDYLTTNLLGRPLIIWRTDAGVKAFLNVCTHRFSTLTDRPQGSCPGKLKCQYHGWEYDGDGNTCKIPDAQSFRPLKKGELGLREYRTETVGQLIFVTLSSDAPSVREYLGGEMVELCERWFSPQHRLTLVSDMPLACNWKIAVENVLESYHIACVHPKSFSEYPQADHCTHAFHPTFDHYIHDFADEPRYAKPERTVAWFIGRPPDYQWHHLLRYPNVILGGAGPWHYIQMIWPTGPATSRSLWITMHDAGPRGGWWPFLMHRALYRYGRVVARQVQQEDAIIYPSVHRGTAAPDRPHGGGLISAREERIFAFQEAVLRGTGEPLPLRDQPVNARSSKVPVG